MALSVQFKAIPTLGAPQIGILWRNYRQAFPKTEQHAPLDPVIELFGDDQRTARKATVEILDTPPMPRCWFLDQGGTELIQVQQDRFAHNWRKVGGVGDYPRYPTIRAKFESELGQFALFLEEEHLGEFTPNQCEVTYVNHIDPPAIESRHGELERILTTVANRYSDDFLPRPESTAMSLKYPIVATGSGPIGRLHINLVPAIHVTTKRPIFVLTLTARGAPQGEGIPGVFDFLDVGREWVVRGFTSITTSEMHRTWGRSDV